MKATHYAAKASAHRVHAEYAKAERTNATRSIWLWSFTTGLVAYFAVTDPGIGRFALLAIGATGVAISAYVRHGASQRHEGHAAQADKYERRAYGNSQHGMENR